MPLFLWPRVGRGVGELGIDNVDVGVDVGTKEIRRGSSSPNVSIRVHRLGDKCHFYHGYKSNAERASDGKGHCSYTGYTGGSSALRFSQPYWAQAAR